MNICFLRVFVKGSVIIEFTELKKCLKFASTRTGEGCCQAKLGQGREGARNAQCLNVLYGWPLVETNYKLRKWFPISAMFELKIHDNFIVVLSDISLALKRLATKERTGIKPLMNISLSFFFENVLTRAGAFLFPL